MHKFSSANLFKSDTIHDWLVADSKLEKPRLPEGAHERIDAMSVWASHIPKLMRGGSDHFLNSLAQGKAQLAEHLATTGVGYTVGMLLKNGVSEDLPNGPTCAAIAISSKIGASILSKALKQSLKRPSYESLADISTRALSASSWAKKETAESQLTDEAFRYGEDLDLDVLASRLPDRFSTARKEQLMRHVGQSLEQIATYKPETPIRNSIEAVKHKISERKADFPSFER